MDRDRMYKISSRFKAFLFLNRVFNVKFRISGGSSFLLLETENFLS